LKKIDGGRPRGLKKQQMWGGGRKEEKPKQTKRKIFWCLETGPLRVFQKSSEQENIQGMRTPAGKKVTRSESLRVKNDHLKYKIANTSKEFHKEKRKN